jgi:hypothetical protein
MSTAYSLAQSISTELNLHQFTMPFEAQCLVLPSFDAADLQMLRVSVVPRMLEIELATRNSCRYTVGIDIGVQRRIENTPEETVETLGGLVDEISLFLRENSLHKFPSAQWHGVINDPLYVAEHLVQKRCFTSVLSVKYILFD